MAQKTIEEFVTLPDGSVVKNHLRHNFDKPTKLLLQHMAAGVCSNPDCYEHTIGSNIERNSYAGNGVAAHLCAAAPGPGAARYDKNQTKEQREHYSNGIWLCGSCSMIIDRDEARYPLTLLNNWKRSAEVRSMSLIGQKSITPFELQNSVMEAIIETTKSIYGGLNPRQPVIVQCLASYEGFMNSLDSDFQVRVTSDSKNLFHEISARNGHSPKVSMVFRGETYQRAQLAWQTMLENGQSLEISTNDFKFKGSELFESLNESLADGVLKITPHPKKFQTGIFIVSDNSEFELAIIESQATTGTKKFSLCGEAFDGILSFDYNYDIESGLTNFNYIFKVDFWKGQKITNLTHYNKLMKAYQFICKSKNLKISVRLLIDNGELSLGEGPSSAYDDIFDRIQTIMYLTECSNKIARKFNRPLHFRTLELSDVEDELIIRYARALDGGVHDTYPAGSEICTATLVDVPPELMTAMENNDINANIRFSENPTFDFFGNIVTLPSLITDMTSFDLHLFTGVGNKDKGALYCIVYADENTQSVQYLASDEIYTVHKRPDADD